jgi:hypothetical protein
VAEEIEREWNEQQQQFEEITFWNDHRRWNNITAIDLLEDNANAVR